MATRFYLPSTGAAPISPGFGGWGQTTSADRLAAVKTRISSAMTNKSTANSSTVQTILNRQYVYGPIAAQTINGNVKGQLRGLESNAAMDATAAIHIRVVKPDATDRGTLLAITAAALAGSNEYPTGTATNKNTLVSTALSSVTAVAGDYLVIEIGVKQNSASTNRSVTHVFGDNDATTDLPEDQTTTATNNPWIEFSVTITDATFTPQHTAFRFAADGLETHALATVTNNGKRVIPLQGYAGGYISTPDTGALRTTDLDVAILVAPEDWTPSTELYPYNKKTGATSNQSWQLALVSTGAIRLYWYADGTTQSQQASDAAVSFSDGQWGWVRATLDVDDGSGHKVITFYTAAFDGTDNVPTSWTQLGSQFTVAGTTGINGNAAPLTIGSYDGGGTFPGIMMRALLRSGINGSIVADCRPNSDAADGVTSFTSSSATGETYTLNNNNWLAAQGTNVTLPVYADRAFTLRDRVQEAGGLGGATTDDWQPQYQKNGAGSWIAITALSTCIRARSSTTLTDQGATTNKLGAGSGSFVAGLVTEDGTADNKQLTALNFTEFLHSLEIVGADVVAGDVFTFRMTVNGSTMTESVTPQLTIGTVTAAVTSGGPFPHYTRRQLSGGMVGAR